MRFILFILFLFNLKNELSDYYKNATILKMFFENCKTLPIIFYFRYKTLIESLLKRTLT